LVVSEVPWSSPVGSRSHWKTFFLGMQRRYDGELPYIALVLEMLVQAGAEVDTVDRKHQNPLHYACRKGATPMTVECLLNLGVSADARDDEGRRPAEYASPEIQECIRRHLAGGRAV
jgi:ankyrin repeat protein